MDDDYRKGRESVGNEYSNLCLIHKSSDKSLKRYDYNKAILKFDKCDISKDDIILDVGCGTGNLLRYLKDKIDFNECNYTGIDFSEQMINYCQTKYPNANFICGDILENESKNNFYINFDKKYDFVISLSSVQQKVAGIKSEIYITNLITNFFNLTKNNGCVIFDIFSSKFVDYKEDFLIYLDPLTVLNICFSMSYSIKMDSTLSPYEVLFQIEKK